MTEPFDRSLPSPIAALLAARASSSDSVVTAIPTDLQQRMFVASGLEERLIEVARDDPSPALIVLSGSAGGGKSASIAYLHRIAPDAFGPVLEDATHADSPANDQVRSLEAFFAPLADDAAPYSGPTMLAAMNTGMAVQFFGGAASATGRFSALGAAILSQLGIGDVPGEARWPRPVVVVNLDTRRTAGSPDGLFSAMLARLEPDDPAGIMAGAPRCATCLVTASCFVRANAQLLSRQPAMGVFDGLAGQLALDRGRSLQPRALWDLASEFVTGGDSFPKDPCDRIAEIDHAGDRRAVWDGLLWNGAFVRPAGAAARDLADPSYVPSGPAHRLVSRAGIAASRDAAEFEIRFGASPAAPCVSRATEVLDSPASEERPERSEIGRALVRAAILAGDFAVAPSRDTFDAALAEYPAVDSWGDSLAELVDLLGRGLSAAFGLREPGMNLFQTEAPSERGSTEVLVAAAFSGDARVARVLPDPARAASPIGAAIAGHRPLAVLVDVAGVRLTIDRRTYTLLANTAAGTVPSSADLEGFYALRRAAEALGRQAAGAGLPLIIHDRTSRRRYRLSRELDLRGRESLTFREAGRG